MRERDEEKNMNTFEDTFILMLIISGPTKHTR
jgi:hypothetical protein